MDVTLCWVVQRPPESTTLVSITKAWSILVLNLSTVLFKIHVYCEIRNNFIFKYTGWKVHYFVSFLLPSYTYIQNECCFSHPNAQVANQCQWRCRIYLLEREWMSWCIINSNISRNVIWEIKFKEIATDPLYQSTRWMGSSAFIHHTPSYTIYVCNEVPIYLSYVVYYLNYYFFSTKQM